MKRHTVWLRGVLTAWGIGALVLSIGVGEAPAEETHEVEHKPAPVDKNDKIDKNDEEIVKPETMTIAERIITVTSKTFLPPKNEPPNKEWKFKSFGSTHVDIHDLPPDGLSRRVVPPAATNDTKTRIKVEAVGLEANAALWPLRCEGNLEPPKDKGKPKKWHWSAKAGRIKIEYIGGTHATDATKEDYKSLGGEYVMRGYMLKITCPNIKTETDVTWTIKKGETEVGTYHQAGAWANYQTALPTKPKSQTIYWRSPYAGGTINDAYTISASFTTPEGKPVTLTREIRSRELNPENADHRDKFNEDADMAQRAMIQVLYLDKGRLTEYRVGKYDRNAQGFYTRGDGKNPWSAISDEVWNFDKFTLGNAGSYTLQLRIVTGIWQEYSYMMDAGRLASAINQNVPVGAYATYRTTAVTQSGLDIPDPYSETALLDGICKQEGVGAGVATHCFDLHVPLYWNSLKIGENNSPVGGLHTYTDGGLGWGSVQPYNRGTRNLYDPQGNMTRVAELVKDHLPGADAVPGKKSRIWHAVYGYHHGSTHTTKTPAQLRESQPEAAGYADAVFGRIGAPFTPVPTTNADN